MTDFEEECRDRQLAELEFISAAYNPETEAWHDSNVTGNPEVHRQLSLPLPLPLPSTLPSQLHNDTVSTIIICLSLTMPFTYPVGEEPLQVTGRLCDDESVTDTRLRKIAINALPHLVSITQQVANESVGMEAIFLVLSRAEEWVCQGEWKQFYERAMAVATAIQQQTDEISSKSQTETETKTEIQQTSQHNMSQHSIFTFGRRLIYSHHIISKIKRADIKALASDLNLTGYMKIGWPGILIIEGVEDDCIDFYDTIRRWKWQYLVVRSEQQFSISIEVPTSKDQIIQGHRKFKTFQEVEDLSIVAQHCRNVGLESLFRTSMKVYENDSLETNEELLEQNRSLMSYGALIHVDHMNDPKGYRKWLRKTAKEIDCYLMIKQCYVHDDFLKRPKIVVGIVATSSDHVSAFMKRWRTSRVDVDSKGKACLERKMTIIAEGVLPNGPNSMATDNNGVDWERAMAEDSITTSELLLGELLLQIGGTSWEEAFQQLIRTCTSNT